MNSRSKFISLAIIFSLALSGCSFSREVTSLKSYAPSDGNQINIEKVKARNFMVVSEDGQTGVVLGSLVNDGQSTSVAEVQFVQPDGTRVSRSIELAPASKADIGYNGSEPFPVVLDSVPGSLVTLYFVVDGQPETLEVPVMDGSLAEYRPFLGE